MECYRQKNYKSLVDIIPRLMEVLLSKAGIKNTKPKKNDNLLKRGKRKKSIPITNYTCLLFSIMVNIITKM